MSTVKKNSQAQPASQQEQETDAPNSPSPVVGVFPNMPELSTDGPDPITQLVIEAQAMLKFAEVLRGIPPEVALRVMSHFTSVLVKAAKVHEVQRPTVESAEETRAQLSKMEVERSNRAEYQREYRARKAAERARTLKQK